MIALAVVLLACASALALWRLFSQLDALTTRVARLEQADAERATERDRTEAERIRRAAQPHLPPGTAERAPWLNRPVPPRHN